MSADLWKEFGYGNDTELNQNPWAQQAQNGSAEKEEWGEFENAEAVTPRGCAQEEIKPSSMSSAAGQPNPAQPKSQSTSGVLFDVEMEAENVVVPSADLTAITQPFEPLCDPLERPLKGVKAVDATQISHVDVTEDNQDEDWADFEAPEQNEISPQMHNGQSDQGKPDLPDTSINVKAKESGSFTGPEARHTILADTSMRPVTAPPPSNVPPPSVLLSLASALVLPLPPEMRSLAMSALTAPSDDQRSDKTEEIAHDLSMLRAIARIIAGRKHRWKRDNLLAQSVKIGPSHGGKAGGMKLAGVDKTEGRREDQEVAEVIRAWRQHAGTLKAAIVKLASANEGSQLSLPEIGESLVARTVKGTLSAPRCCIICGLKRDERIEKVDAGVDDSFGEYWEQHWGHVDCKRFWDAYHGKLQQR